MKKVGDLPWKFYSFNTWQYHRRLLNFSFGSGRLRITEVILESKTRCVSVTTGVSWRSEYEFDVGCCRVGQHILILAVGVRDESGGQNADEGAPAEGSISHSVNYTSGMIEEESEGTEKTRGKSEHSKAGHGGETNITTSLNRWEDKAASSSLGQPGKETTVFEKRYFLSAALVDVEEGPLSESTVHLTELTVEGDEEMEQRLFYPYLCPVSETRALLYFDMQDNMWYCDLKDHILTVKKL